MRVFNGVLPFVVSLGLVLAVTAILWHINLTTAGSRGLVYIYLFPVVLIAALYNGRLAVVCAAVAIVCADLFLQEPLYSLANDIPREYGDLVYFALLAVTAIKSIRVLARPNPHRPRPSRLVRRAPLAD
jgi:K+-sensing histidine kinase KdpD